TVTVSGSDALAIVPALGLVVVAAALAIIAASVRLRRVVGALVIIASVAGIIITVGGGSAVDHSFVRAVHESPAFAGQSVPEAQTSVLWPVVAVAGFAVAAVAGALVIWWAGSWATMGRRYDAPAAHGQPTQADSDAEIWQAQDDGRDPTNSQTARPQPCTPVPQVGRLDSVQIVHQRRYSWRTDRHQQRGPRSWWLWS